MSHSKVFLLGFIALLIITAGCKESGNISEDKEEIVELTFAFSGTEQTFNERFKEPVEEHFDQYVLKHIEAHPGNAEQLEEMIAKDNIPDLWITSTGSSTGMFQKELAYDLNDVFDLVDFDLSRIEENIVAEIQMRSNEFLDADSNILGALPLKRGLSALYYNKDIFDLFGADYPTDNMTWDEVANLGSKVSGERNGDLYHGLHVHFHSAYTQHGVDHQDENGDPQFDKEPAFRMTVDLMDKVFKIPGNYPEHPKELNDAFIDGNLAMHATYDSTVTYVDAPFEWDIVTYPSWEHLPGIAPTSNSDVIGITNTSDHIEEAFRVIDFLLSDEYQTEFSKKGHASPLVNEEVHAVFGEEEPAYQDIHVPSLFDMTPQKRSANRFEIEHSLEAAGEPWHGRVFHDFYESDATPPEFIRELQERGEVVLKELEEKN